MDRIQYVPIRLEFAQFLCHSLLCFGRSRMDGCDTFSYDWKICFKKEFSRDQLEEEVVVL